MAQPSTQPPQRSSADSVNFSQDSYNHGGLITFILAMGFSILFFIVLLLAHPGVDLKEVAPDKAATTEAGAAPAAPAAPSAEKAP
jgi:hypothetical protein